MAGIPAVEAGLIFKSGVVVTQQENACILLVLYNFLEASNT